MQMLSIGMVGLVSIWSMWHFSTTSVYDSVSVCEGVFKSIGTKESGTTYTYLFPEEIEAFGITKAKYKKIFDSLITPRLSRLKFMNFSDRRMFADGAEGSVIANYQDVVSKKVVRLNNHAFVTTDGPRLTMLSILTLGWQASGQLQGMTAVKANDAGISSDRNALIQLGVYGYWDEFQGKIVPWPAEKKLKT